MASATSQPCLSMEGLHEHLRLTGLAFEAGRDGVLTVCTSDAFEAGCIIQDIITAQVQMAAFAMARPTGIKDKAMPSQNTPRPDLTYEPLDINGKGADGVSLEARHNICRITIVE